MRRHELSFMVVRSVASAWIAAASVSMLPVDGVSMAKGQIRIWRNSATAMSAAAARFAFVASSGAKRSVVGIGASLHWCVPWNASVMAQSVQSI